MKANTILATFITIFVAFTVLVSNAQAYQFYSDKIGKSIIGCVECHTEFCGQYNINKDECKGKPYDSAAEGIS